MAYYSLKDDTNESLDWFCWQESIPILDFFSRTNRVCVKKDELLEFCQRFRLMKVTDLNERLAFLEERRLIMISNDTVICMW